MHEQGPEWFLTEDNVIQALFQTTFRRGYVLVSPHIIASLRAMSRFSGEQISLAKLGSNTAKVKRQLLGKTTFEEILINMKQTVPNLQCTDEVKDYLLGVTAEELRGFFCKIATVARNFIVVPSANWRGDEDTDPAIDLCGRSRQVRKKRRVG